MKTYKTSEIAKMMRIHPNTVRLYEQLRLIPKPERQANGYRIFTDKHIGQFRLVRIALKIEILQNGLRRKIIETVKAAAKGDFNQALLLAEEYLLQVQQEQSNAEEAIQIVNQLLRGQIPGNDMSLTRKEASEYLDISMDTLRNWELNGLLSVKRRKNGYRIYENDDIQRLKMIRSLRCANYSLESILRMLNELSENPQVNIKEVLNTPKEHEDIISVCDKLISSLKAAEVNAKIIIDRLLYMKHAW